MKYLNIVNFFYAKALAVLIPHAVGIVQTFASTVLPPGFAPNVVRLTLLSVRGHEFRRKTRPDPYISDFVPVDVIIAQAGLRIASVWTVVVVLRQVRHEAVMCRFVLPLPFRS